MRKHYSVKDAAKALGISTNTLYKYLNEGKLKGKRIGRGRFKIPHSELFPYVSSESASLFTKPAFHQALELFKGRSYQHKDFVFFDLFLVVIFLGDSLLNFFYRLNISTPAQSIIFILFSLFSLVTAFLLLFETFLPKFEKYYPTAHVMALIASGSSAYFYFSQGRFAAFSIFFAILVVLIIQTFKGLRKLHEKCSFETEFLKVVFVSTIVWGILIFFKPNTFPIFIMADVIAKNNVLFIFLWSAIVELPLIALLIPRFRLTRIDFFLLPLLGFLMIASAIFLSIEGRWVPSFYLYIIAIFQFFLLWWRRQKGDISAKLAPFVTLSIVWMLFVVFSGVVATSLFQKSVIDNSVVLVKQNLSGMSREIDFLFETIDRRLTSANLKLEVSNTILQGDEEAAISKSKEIFDAIPELRRVLILDINGKVLGAYPRDVSLQGSQLGNREYFQVVKSTHEPYTSDIFAAVTGAQVVVRAHPVFKGNEFVGVVVATPDLGDLSRKYNSDSRGVFFYAYDRKGNYVIHPNVDELGKAVSKNILRQSQEGVYQDMNTFRVFEKMNTLNWTLFAESPVISFLQVFAGLNIMIGILILTGISLSFAAIIIAKKWINKH